MTGGMSGAAVKPIALRMVWQVARAVKIPVVGLGGIMNARDAVEFLLAGATAIQIGTANFIDPTITLKVAEGINEYLDRHGFKSVREIVGALEVMTSGKGRPFASIGKKKDISCRGALFPFFTFVESFTQEVGAESAGTLQGLLQLPFLDFGLVSGK